MANEQIIENLKKQLTEDVKQELIIKISPTHHQELNNEMGQTKWTDDAITINVENSDSDTILAHELLHAIYQAEHRFPEIYFNVVFPNSPDRTDQAKMVGQFLYEIVVHQQLLPELTKLGLLDENTKKRYLAGFLKQVPKESPETAGYVLFRILKIFDLLVTFDNSDKVREDLRDYPVALKYATQLYDTLMRLDVNDSRHFAKTLHDIYELFDEISQRLGMMTFGLTKAVTIEPVLSQHQLALSLGQHFLFQKSELLTTEGELATLGVDKETMQNNFVIATDEQKTAKDFIAIYQGNLKEFLSDNNIPFFLR